jgi:hypothetical protein
VFKSRLLRKVYVSDGEMVSGGWNRLHSEEITDMHNSPSIFGDQMKNNEMGEACSKYGERRASYRVLIGKGAEENN